MTDAIYIGLLRGINVGGANKLPMADLLATAALLGFAGTRTYLQSGNIVFSAAKADEAEIAGKLADALERRNGLTAGVMVRNLEQWGKIVADNPFAAAAAQPKTLHAFVMAAEPSAERLRELKARDFGADAWRMAGDTLYMHTPDGFGKSKLAGSVERLLKVPMTGRNWNTVLALWDLASAI